MARFRAILKSTVQACADYIWPPMCAGCENADPRRARLVRPMLGFRHVV